MAKTGPLFPKPNQEEFDLKSEFWYSLSFWYEQEEKPDLFTLAMQRAQYWQEREALEEFEARRMTPAPLRRQRLRPGSAANSVGMSRDEPYVTPPYQFCLSYREIDRKGCDLPRGHMQLEHHFSRSLSDEELEEARADEASRRADANTMARIFYGRGRATSPLKEEMPRFDELKRSDREQLINHGLEAVRVIRNRQQKEETNGS